MTLRGNTLLVALLTGSLIGVVACGDDDETTSSTSSSSTTTTTSTGGTGGTGGTTSNGGGGEGGSGVDCTQACTDLFNCGLEDDGNGMQLCPGFDDGGAGGGATGVGLDAFLNGANMDGCIAGCETTPAVAALVDPNNCAMTVGTISAASSDFADSCAGN